jgi:thiosulfate/3-mercaptopyruvate sulfurtransferase
MLKNALVTTEWLAQHLQDAHLRIVDIRGHVLPASQPPPHYFNHREDYQQAHIPGAVFVDWVHEITNPDDPRHAQIAPPERFSEAMQRAGIGSETLVVAYDDANGMFAARLWWALNYYGHEQVVVLDGGWQKWVRENRPVTVEVPSIPITTFTPVINPALRKNAQQVLEMIDTDGLLVDVRSVEEYEGRASRAQRKGHIPGAVNLPRTELLKPDGTLLEIQDLRDLFSLRGVDEPQTDVVFYCNGGVSASFALLALHQAGLTGSVYDGSWKEWGNDETKPIA